MAPYIRYVSQYGSYISISRQIPDAIIYTMTSILRRYDAPNRGITSFSPIRSPCYYDNEIGHVVLIPFSAQNGVLDINVQDGSLEMINNGDTYGDSGFSWRMVKISGNTARVTSLGSNFVKWMQQYTGLSGETVQLHIAPMMMQVRQSVQFSGNGPLNSQYAIRESQDLPADDQYIVAGSEANNYYNVWVFQSPITVVIAGRYFTLHSQFTNPS